jgi:creatinine amidohydrolase
MMAPVPELAQLTWEDVERLDRARTIAILPAGAIEAHGPHLPLDADVVIAEAMARAGAERLAARGYGTVILPPLCYTAAGFAAEFPGTIGVSGAAITTLIVDIARSLTRHGFAQLAIANAHLDPEHLSALNGAVNQAKTAGLLPIACPDLTRKPWGGRLGDEFKSGACHAGRFESSIVLAERAGSVREDIRGRLDPNMQSLAEAIRKGRKTFAEAGGPRAYFGDPAAATKEEGVRTIAVLGQILEEAVVALL